jgi:hypothetical protein
MNSQTPNLKPADVNLLKGTGKCTVSGCGCTGFVAAATTEPHCIGKNAAGGTCNHSGNQHE